LGLEGTDNLDSVAMQELRAVQEKIGEAWPVGTTDILEQRNPDLLRELGKIQGVINSIIAIPNWPTPIKKQWRDALAEYEKTAMLCVTYANRHLPQEAVL